MISISIGICVSCITVGNVIIRKFGMCIPEVKRHLFRAHCSAVYCRYLWSSFTVRSLRKLRVCQKRHFAPTIRGASMEQCQSSVCALTSG